MKPINCAGVAVLSLGMLIEEGQPLVWRGPMAGNALKQLVTDTLWSSVDYLVVDMPPGTGDVHLTLSQLLPDSFAVLVTTPHELSLADARKSAAMCQIESMRINLLGFIENMSWFAPADRSDERYYLFGQGGGSALAEEFNVPLLTQMPLMAREGRPAQRSEMGGSTNDASTLADFPLTDEQKWSKSPYQPIFQSLSATIARAISIHRAGVSDGRTPQLNSDQPGITTNQPSQDESLAALK